MGLSQSHKPTQIQPRAEPGSAEHLEQIAISEQRFAKPIVLTQEQQSFVELITPVIEAKNFGSASKSEPDPDVDHKLADMIEAGLSPKFEFKLSSDNRYIFKPLPVAVMYELPELAVACLKAGAPIVSQNERMVSRLYLTQNHIPLLARATHPQVIDSFIEMGADPLEAFIRPRQQEYRVYYPLIWNTNVEAFNPDAFCRLLDHTVAQAQRFATQHIFWNEHLTAILSFTLSRIIQKAKHYECAKKLIEAGADPTLHEPDRYPPYFMAVKGLYNEEQLPFLELCLNARPDAVNSTVHGDTALIVAAAATNDFAVKELIKRGADITIANAKGYTAYDLAASAVEEVKEITATEADKQLTIQVFGGIPKVLEPETLELLKT